MPRYGNKIVETISVGDFNQQFSATPYHPITTVLNFYSITFVMTNVT
ncbi:hypothetical protein [Staphylococcus gallinarum]